MPRGTYGNGKPKASKGRAKMRARRKLWKRVLGTQSLSPGKLAGIVTQRKSVSKAVKPIRDRPAKSKSMALKSSRRASRVKKMIWWTGGSKRKTGERGVR